MESTATVTENTATCPECGQPAQRIVFESGRGAQCRECFDTSLIKRIWRFLNPTPKWVKEFEAALEADRVARQQMYAEWDKQIRGEFALDVRRESE